MDSSILARRIIVKCMLIALSSALFLPVIQHPGWVAVPAGLGALFIILLSSLIQDVTSIKNLPRKLIETLDHENLTDIARSDSPWAPAASILINRIEVLVAQREQQHFLLEQITGNSTDGLLCYDNNRGVRFTNRAFLSICEMPSLVNYTKLQQHNPLLFDQLETDATNETSFTLSKHGLQIHYKCSKVKFRTGDEWLTLAIFTDISAGIFRRESESWHRLLRILNHEIANSVAPVASLVRVLSQRYSTFDPELEEGLGIIVRRIEGMLQFSENIRSFSRLPDPVMESVNLNQMIKDTVVLMNIRNLKVEIQSELPMQDVIIKGDINLLQQMIINLVQNSLEAVVNIEEPFVCIRLSLTDDSALIIISDNGPGIEEVNRDDIFVPFFTTKAKGSGIGLSLSREIAVRHGGMISLDTTPVTRFTTFMIALPNNGAEIPDHILSH